MKSFNIVSDDRNRVVLKKEDVGVLKDDGLLCEAYKSLISTGTELTCLRQNYSYRKSLWILGNFVYSC